MSISLLTFNLSLLGALAVQSGESVSAASDVSLAPRLPAGTIVHSEFAKTYTLDNGTLTISPALQATVNRSEIAVAKQIEATYQVGGMIPVALGYGSVSLRWHMKGLPAITGLDAWVGLLVDGVTSCGIQPLTTTTPPRLASNGWAAVVIGNSPGSPAFVYKARTYRCDRYGASSVRVATEVISEPWKLVHWGASVPIPYCGTYDGYLDSGNPGTSSFTVAEYAEASEDPSLSNLVTPSSPCEVAATVTVATDATAATKHAPLGPLRQTVADFSLGEHPLRAQESSCEIWRQYSAGSFSFSYPECWHAEPFRMNLLNAIGFAILANEPLRQPCVSRRSQGSTTITCGWPVEQLVRGGVAVTWDDVGSPDASLRGIPGRAFAIAGRPAKESIITSNACSTLHATEQVTVSILEASSNRYTMTACLKSPNISANTMLVNEMVRSVRFTASSRRADYSQRLPMGPRDAALAPIYSA